MDNKICSVCGAGEWCLYCNADYEQDGNLCDESIFALIEGCREEYYNAWAEYISAFQG